MAHDASKCDPERILLLSKNNKSITFEVSKEPAAIYIITHHLKYINNWKYYIDEPYNQILECKFKINDIDCNLKPRTSNGH